MKKFGILLLLGIIAALSVLPSTGSAQSHVPNSSFMGVSTAIPVDYEQTPDFPKYVKFEVEVVFPGQTTISTLVIGFELYGCRHYGTYHPDPKPYSVGMVGSEAARIFNAVYTKHRLLYLSYKRL
ncbi:MAG: hypothetical protein LBV32_08895 [Tannerellaceae bacterium]|jgi:hypothetical protein|nr:hypothetical protein [Tannerellaceae bacterium]